MRTAAAWILMATAITAVRAQSDQIAPVRTYDILAENEDWSFLKDPSLRQDLWDRMKYIPLSREGWYLTMGGEVRKVFEL